MVPKNRGRMYFEVEYDKFKVMIVSVPQITYKNGGVGILAAFRYHDGLMPLRPLICALADVCP
ncbi:hypothetical protein ASZ97_12400 [Brucella melitensis]|nr:hypothetical protein BK187_00535 [Brucella melitensis]ARY36434.1 hypothetical protein BK217_00535 [Brucella melitensis]KYW88688.1 hypothetical protein ASZ97_12400 [Brucella melitensis]HBW76710.1 hypothetical protein [Brucella melitensis]